MLKPKPIETLEEIAKRRDDAMSGLNYRRGTRRLLIAAVVLWEAIIGAAVIQTVHAWATAASRYHADPFAKFGAQPPTLGDLSSYAWLAVLPPLLALALWYGGRWVVRGFSHEAQHIAGAQTD